MSTDIQKVVPILVILCLYFQDIYGSGYESIVPGPLQKCCGDNLAETCRGIDTVTRGQDGHHYIFSNDYVIKTHFDAKGMPHIANIKSFQPNREWFPKVKLHRTNGTESGVMDSSAPKAAILYEGLITVMKDGRFYQFEQPGKLYSYDADCDEKINSANLLHPLYCETGQGQLIDTTISNARAKDARDPEIKAFFGDEGLVYEKNYAGRRAQKGRNKTPFQGMSSLVIYHEQVMVHSKSVADFGYAFEETGYACRFVLRNDEVTEHDTPALHSPFLNCLPSNIFLGCPQSFCFRSDIDDLLLSSYGTPGTSNSGSKLIVYRGHYYFEADANVPVIVPPVESHQVLSVGNGNKVRHAYIDAAFEINEGTHREFMAFIKESDIYMYGNPSGSGAVKKIYDVFPGIWDPILLTDNFGTIDAAFYSPIKAQVYLLIGSSFVSYTHDTSSDSQSSTITFTFKEGGTFSEFFPGLPANVDAATAFGGMVYIFKDNWVYTLNEEQIGLTAVFPELSYYDPDTGTGFFQADHCGKSAADWRALKPLVIQPPPAIQSEWKQVKPNYGGEYLVFAVFGILLFLWMIPYMFTCWYCSRSGRHLTASEMAQDRAVPQESVPGLLQRTLDRVYQAFQSRTHHPEAIPMVEADPEPATVMPTRRGSI